MSEELYVSAVVADLRREATSHSERVSQALFLTPLVELDSHEGWRRVRTPDGYEGWIKASHTQFLPRLEPQWKVSLPIVEVHEEGTGRILGRLTLDTRIPATLEGDKLRLVWPDGRIGYLPQSVVKPCSWRGGLQDLLDVAQHLVGTPYLWGGTSTFGFDCSGLVQRLFHFVFNRWLPRDSRDQRNVGLRLAELSQLTPGDLLFFPGHVGLWLGEGRMIHASAHAGQVVVTRLDPPEDSYAQKLREAFEFGIRVTDLMRGNILPP